jgi:transposase
MTLSQDLRVRIVDLVGTGVSRGQAARQFKVGVSSAIRFVKQAEELGHVEPKRTRKRKSCLDQFRADILDWIADQPDLTLAQLRERLDEHHGLRVGSTTLHDWFRANQITYKKNCTRQ